MSEIDKFKTPKPFEQDNSRKPYYNDDSNYTTNAPSYYDDLARKSELLKTLANRIWEYDKVLYEKLKEVQDTLTEYGDILDGKIEDFDNIILDKTQKWLDENMENILTKAVQLVWFGLTDDGYFMAVIPENWEDVQFDTTNEGQLVLIN